MSRRSLDFRLLCFSAAAATLPALVITVILRSISSRALEASIQRNQMEIARRIADEVSGQIRYAQGLLAFVARSPALASGRPSDAERALQNLLRSLPSLQEAMVVLTSGEEWAKVNPQGVSRHLIRRAVDAQNSFIGSPFFSGNRLPTILIGEPIRPSPTRPTGTLVAKMSFSTLGQLLQQTRVGERGEAFIVDRRGALLADVDERRVRAHTNLPKTAVVQDWLKQSTVPTTLHEYVDEHGFPLIALAYPIPLLEGAVVVQQPKADVFAPLVRMRNQFLLWTFIWLSLFLALAILIAWRIHQPLRQLQTAAEQIAHGKMDVQLAIHTRDELEDLGAAFTKMADSLRQLEGMRRDLINMVVHDLKSPLTSILVSMDFLLSGEPGVLNEEQRKFLLLGNRSGQELLMLIQNLLDVAKMEEGKLALKLETFSPVAWAEEVIATFRPLAEAGKKKLSLSIAEDFPFLKADKPLLTRVLGNLLSNALRHTASGVGEVTVSLARQGDRLAIAVSDNGQGIPSEYQERIFEKFVQVERKRVHLRTGTGLGLTFCKMAVEAHGGRIFVQSVVNEGSTFTFVLPMLTGLPETKAAAPTPAPTVVTSTPI